MNFHLMKNLSLLNKFNIVDIMKKILFGTILSLMIVSQVACNQDIDGFDNSVNYITFDLPYEVDAYGRKTGRRVDSLFYSFAMDGPEITFYKFKVPVNISGLRMDRSRAYKVAAVLDGSTVEMDDWNAASLSEALVEANCLRDTLEVVVNRTEILKKESRTLVLALQENEEFSLGSHELLRMKLVFADILQEPSWWKNWESYFGPFVREKYQKWQEIYYLGADPNVEQYGPDKGKQLYWNQMPYYNVASWYPSTVMFIGKLKQYFIDNEIYPNGDKSLPRIMLP